MYEPANNPAQTAFGYAAANVPSPPLHAMYDLRPLSTGEILDRTFSLYRQRFWMYCGLSALPAAVATLVGLAQMIWMKTPATVGVAGASPDASAAALKTMVVAGSIGLFLGILQFIAYGITQAATVSAVSSVYLGHETSVAISLRVVKQKWWRYPGIVLWQSWSAIWIFILLLIPAFTLILMKVTGLVALGGFLVLLAFGSLIYGLIAYIRNSLAIAVSVFEGTRVRAAMRRSKTLAAQSKWRIFLVIVMLSVLSLVVGMLQMPFILMLAHSHTGQRILAQGISLLIGFLSNSLIGPIGAIAFCLFYFDNRVRKEGFDIEALMDPTLGSGRPRVEAPAPGLLPSGFAPSGFTASPSQPSGLAAPPPAPPPAPDAASPFAPSGFTAPSIDPQTPGAR